MLGKGNVKIGKFKFNSQWLVGAVILAVIGVGGWQISNLVLNREEPVAVRLLPVKRGTVESTINESGVVELRDQQILTSPTEGAVERVLVQPGDRIQAGQTLITLRYPERQTALANQEVKIQQQRRILERHRLQIAEAKEQIRADELKLRPLVAGAKEGAISRVQVYEQEDKLRETRAKLRDAQADARTAALELEALQLERKRIQQEVQDSIVTAPIDGVVLGVNVKNGDGVEFRTNLLTVGDPRQVLVKLQLSTLNATQVRPNQLARVRAIGSDRQTFTGRIQSLYPQAVKAEEAEPSGGSQKTSKSSSSEQPAVPAIVLLDTPTRTLIPGSRVNVEILLKQRQNVVVLPTEAIQREESEPFVWVRDSQGNAQKRLVKLGLEGLTNVEVTSGLDLGDRVIIPTSESDLEPGTPVVAQ
ncbi:efflux RND transporter periplasmic adaptor subunit [Chlorogloeopsis sp. ULAP01]|uniref:efflux RND transporter periplasmic adaptor subunit n=1 Tax=Chlorogloeopsis sp. ULAP01 TaxID=3056483 RepID=UPI0025AA68CA|nr:efflux RND transporter periplasmic adaptor subunit [Chlorogloeopsis sp. ULAP01]MDM9379813.1 efflux RND transporter periplasmic adaptor subunit [Chlorogloeopsis sp. ULAP01]